MIATLVLVALWAFAEAILFFIVADVPISYVALRYGLKSAAVAALLAAVMAAVGGVALVLWARSDPTHVAELIVALPAIDGSMLVNAHIDLTNNGYPGMFAGSFSGIPYKLYAYAALDMAAGGLPGFFLASIAARVPRFLVVAVVVSGIGKLLARRTGMRLRLAVLALVWTAFYGWYFATMPA